MPFRAGIDLLNLRNLCDGVGRFARQLIDGLHTVDHGNEYFIFVNPEISRDIVIDRPNFHKIVTPVPRRRLVPWNQVYFALKSSVLPVLDLLHSPVTLSPLIMLRSFRTVVTVHDLAFKFYPEMCSRSGRLWWNAAWPLCLKKARHVVASSWNTRADLRRIYAVPEEKLSVVYPYVSIDPSRLSDEIVQAVRTKYGLPEKYVLFVGAPHRRKNLASLVKAFRILKERYGAHHSLVIVGPRGWALEELLMEIGTGRGERDIIVTGFIPDDDLASIYQAADVFVYPSLYEGFGYPPLEAMTFAVPVVMARSSSLPEIGGNAALYVDPHSPEDIARKIWAVIDHRGIGDRLKARGLERSRKFDMTRTIEGYIAVYERITRNGSPTTI